MMTKEIPSTRNRLSNGKITALVFLGLFAAGAATSWIGRMIYPIETVAASQRFELWRKGVRSFHSDGMNGIERNLCEKKTDCTCILFVHGMGDQFMTWRKIFLADDLSWSGEKHLFAFDLPGFGTSPSPSSVTEYRTRLLAQRLSRWIDTVKGCEKSWVVGNSFGGWIAAWLAIEGSPRFQKVVLIGPAGFKGAPLPDFKFLNGSVEELKEFQKRAYFNPRELSESMWKAAAARAKNGNSSEVRSAQTPDDDLDARLALIKRPVIFIQGLADRIIPADYSRVFASKIEGSRFIEIKECGHLPQKECPSVLIRALNEI